MLLHIEGFSSQRRFGRFGLVGVSRGEYYVVDRKKCNRPASRGGRAGPLYPRGVAVPRMRGRGGGGTEAKSYDNTFRVAC